MNHLSSDKRKQLVLVLLLAAIAVAGLWYGLINSQRQRMRVLSEKAAAGDQRLREVKETIANAAQINAQLAETSRRLTKIEDAMASGDLYSWAFNTIRRFKVPYKVDIPQFSQIDGPKDVPLLPQFPYKQASITIGGTAYFHDFGRFVADFENQFPYVRVLNLNLEPVSATTPGTDWEKLSFKMEIATLVKPGTS